MNSQDTREHGRGRFQRGAGSLAFASWLVVGSAALAYDDGVPYQPSGAPQPTVTARASGVGTLGYGPPGNFPGFNGFGLGYHPGYGYGGDALGVGAEGGYPHYGGPGYPHCWPELQRFGKIARFHYYGGPGYPTPANPNFYAPVGPLIAEKPVIEFESFTGGYDYSTGFGGYTGVMPYPEAKFAPFTTAAGGTYSSPSAAPPPPAVRIAPPANPGANRSLPDKDR
jgi:hypothetical protein